MNRQLSQSNDPSTDITPSARALCELVASAPEPLDHARFVAYAWEWATSADGLCDGTELVVDGLSQTDSAIRDREQMGEFDLGELPRRGGMLESLYEAYAAVDGARGHDVPDARMIDEAQVTGHRVYMAAHR